MPKPKKDPLASPGRRTRAYELPNLINVQGSQDPLRQMEDDALRDLSSEYRLLRVEEMIQKKKRQLEKVAPTSDGSMPMRQIEDDALKDLSNEYRQLRVEEMIQKKKRQLEKSTPTSDISMQKQNLDYISTVFRLAKDLQPQQSKDDTLAYVTLFKDLMMDSVKLQNQGGKGPSFFESLVTDPNLFQRTREIFGGGSGVTTQLDLEIEKLRGERHLQATKWELDLRRDELKRQDDDRRTNNLIAMFGPIAAAFAGPAAQRMQQFGQQQAAAHRPTGVPPTVMPPGTIPLSNTIQIRCSCGYTGDVSFEGETPKALRCPECNQELIVGGNPDVSGNP